MPVTDKAHQLFVLGPPRLEKAGRPVHLDTRKALALLIYLAEHDQDFQRDSLTALLWPDLDQQRARAALRRTLTPLNHALGERGLRSSRETVGLNPDFSLWLDARAFEQALASCKTHGHPPMEVCERCLETCQDAIGYYRGDFMAGFSLRDSAAFDDWQFSESERLRRLYSEALEKLTLGSGWRGQPEAAIEFGRQWLALDPLHEPAHRALMRLFAETGQRSLALKQYRDCLRILDQELGVPPLEETSELYEQILDNRHQPAEPGRFALRPAEISPAPIEGRQDFPLVGRSDSLQQLVQAYRSAARSGQFAVIEGEAGIGKTRLAEEIIGYAQEAGGRILVGRCYEGEQNLAYSPINAAFRSTVKSGGIPDLNASLDPVWRYEAARLLPEIFRPEPATPVPEPTDPTTAQSRLFEALRQALLQLCSPQAPAVLLIDDLHWADAASLDFLAFIVRRLHDMPLLIVAAWRSENVPANHPARSLSAEAARIGSGAHIQLKRLSESEVDELSAHVPGLGENLRKSLFTRTEGLPFFIVEYLKAGLFDQGGSLPEGIREIQQSRLAGLDEASRQLVATAAVIGRSFDFETLRSASGRSEEETVSALERLLSGGLLIERGRDELAPGSSPVPPALPAPGYDFSHESLHQIVLEQTSLARRRLLHRRVGESYLTQSRSLDENAARIAYHFSQSGQENRAADFYFRAGEHARKLYANVEALSHYQNALALGHPDSSGIHEAVGDLLTLRGEYARAVVSYDQSTSLAEPADLPRLERKMANVHHRRGDYPLAASHFRAALELFDPSATGLSDQALIHIDWSRTAAHQGEHALSRRLAEEGLRLASIEADPYLISLAHNILGLLARKAGDFPAAHSHLDRALANGDQLPARIAALNNLALVLSDEGQFEDAIRLTRSALEACIRLGDRHREAALRNHLADRLHANGQAEAAMAELKQAVEIFAEIGTGAGELQPEIWKLTEW